MVHAVNKLCRQDSLSLASCS